MYKRPSPKFTLVFDLNKNLTIDIFRYIYIQSDILPFSFRFIIYDKRSRKEQQFSRF